MMGNLHRLNVIAECRGAHLGLWACPPFLFVVMGIVDISAMLGSYVLANRYLDETTTVLLITAVAIFIFVIGNFIITGFNQIAEANRIKNEFISVVSHQLRSPLSVFKWVLDAMAHTSVDAARDPATQSYLGMLRDNAEKMIQLVNMLLEVSRFESGRLVLRQDRVSLDLVTEEFVRSYAPYAKAAHVTIQFTAPANLPPVRGDKEKIKMVVQNLIDNAVRYSRSGGQVTIVVASLGPAMVEWRISDIGIGIAKSQQRYIFQKFFRTDKAVQHQTQGSGLGLYIARSLVVAQGGDMGFTSEEGKGTTFWFHLPAYST